MNNIPLCKIDKNYDAIDIVKEIINSGRFVNGKHIQNFEKQICEIFQVKHAFAVNSGTSAILSALIALNIGPGDEIIVPSMTFFATISPILLLGAKPVFIDINPENFLIDDSLIEDLITPQTKVIMPVHLYGNLANMEKIKHIAQKNNLYIIEDACQAHGAEQNGKKAGSFGDIGCFSFYPSKNLTVFGQGGMVVSNDDNIAKKIEAIRSYGALTKDNHTHLGMNLCMSEITACFGELEAKKLNQINKQRIKIAQYYHQELSDVKQIKLPPMRKDNSSVYHLFVIRIEKSQKYNRDQLKTYLEKKGIETGIHYPLPCHQQPIIKQYLTSNPILPHTEKICQEVLSLPMSAYHTHKELEYVVQSIKTYFQE